MPLVLTKNKLATAMTEASPAGDVLREAVRQAAELQCPKSAGFEGPDTFGRCGQCFICIAQDVADAK